MDRDELAIRLKTIRERAASGEVTVRTFLFGIEFANELQGYSMNDLKAIMKLADTPVSYADKVRTCIRLADFVTINYGGEKAPTEQNRLTGSHSLRSTLPDEL